MKKRNNSLEIHVQIAFALLFVSAMPNLAMAQAQQPPVLMSPIDGLVILTPSSQAPTQIFTWDAPRTGTVPASYLFQLQDANDPASFSWNTDIVATGTRTSTQQIIPPPLRGKTIRWSVSACTGVPANRNCSSPASRILHWPSGLQAPQHWRPLDGELGPETGTTPRFEWTRVGGANYYLLCAAMEPNLTCPGQPTSNDRVEVVKRLGGGNTFAAPDLSRWMGETIYWKAAACDEQDQCAWHGSFRAFTLLNAPQLINPRPDALIIPPNYRVVFTWSVVPGASGYVLTAAKSGESFDLPSEQVSLLTGDKNNMAWNVPEGLRNESGGRVKWTVAACIGDAFSGAQPKCNRQRSFRWLQLALEQSPFRYRVLSGFGDYLYLSASDKYINTNDPVPGATVCLGTRSNPVQYGMATTDSDGYALFPFVPESHYVVSAAVAGTPWFCPGTRFIGIGFVFCPPAPSSGDVHRMLEVPGGGIIGAINQPAHIRVRLNAVGPGPCPLPSSQGDTGTSIDVDFPK